MSQILWRNSRQFPGTRSALRWWRNSYKAELPPRGFVWVIHGLGDHSGRYSEWAQYLNELGYDVLSPDLPGHGLSRFEGQQNRMERVPAMLEEIRHAQEWWIHSGPIAKRGLVHTPWYLVGHSMGALLALNLIIEGKKNELTGDFAQRAFLSAPPLKLRLEVPGWKVALAKNLNKAFPYMELANGIEVEQLSRDAGVQAAAREDKLMYQKASPALFLSMEVATQKVLAQPHDVEIPVFLAVGEADPIVDPQAVKEYYTRLGTHKRFLSLPLARHEILNEVDRQALFAKAAGWLS